MPDDHKPQPPSNPPGLSALTYRVSDYSRTKRRLLDRLYTPVLTSRISLASLKTRDQDDAAIAMIDTWAIVIDVLTFYQERIANEGYWRTAIERQSLIELARMIGCELKPGVAASTYLQFAVEETPSSPKVVTLVQGTQVLSVPAQDELPQTFETSEAIVARADWNALKPRSVRSQDITSNTQQLYLKGTSPQLQIGDRLLLIDAAIDTTNSSILTLTQIETVTEAGYTKIAWKEPLKIEAALRQPRLFAFRQRASLFGHFAPKWETLPDAVKQQYSRLEGGIFRRTQGAWTAISSGLPTVDIRSLVINSVTQDIFAGTAGHGVFRSSDRGETWTAINVGFTNLVIEALFCNQQGHLLAGTPTGGVFRSKDNGETWTPIGIGSVQIESSEIEGKTQWQSNYTGLPNTIVRSLLNYNHDAKTLLFAGTDDGLYRSQNAGKDWNSCALPSQDSSPRAIRALLAIASPKIDQQPKSDERSKSATPNEPFQVALVIEGTQPESSTTQEKTEAPRSIVTIAAPSISRLEFSILPAVNSVSFSPPTIPIAKPLINRSTIAIAAPSTLDRDKVEIHPSLSRKWNLTTTIKQVRNALQKIFFNRNFNTYQLIASPTIHSNESSNSFTRNHASTSTLLDTSSVENHLSATTPDPTESELTTISTPDIVEAVSPEKERIQPAQDTTSDNQENSITHCLFAGTDDGIFRSDDHGDNWESKNEGLETLNITALASYRKDGIDYLFAATQGGSIFRSVNYGDRWESSTQILSNPAVLSLTVAGTTVFAGTTNGQVFQSIDDGATWSEVETQLITTNVTALATNSDSELFAGTRFAKFTADDWSQSGKPITKQPALNNSQIIDLDAIYPKILTGAWLLLINEERVQPCPVIETSTELVSGFTLEAQVTRIRTNVNLEPELLQPATTIVLAQSELLPLAEIPLTVETQGQQIFQDPISRDRIILDQLVQGLQPKQSLILSGKRLRVQLKQVGGIYQFTTLGTWSRFNSGLTNFSVQALAIDHAQQIFAGTADGIFRLSHENNLWEPYGLTNTTIQSLTTSSTGDLFAGTPNGVFRLIDQVWQPMNQGLINQNITVLVAYEQVGTGRIANAENSIVTTSVESLKLKSGTPITIDSQTFTVTEALSGTQFRVNTEIDSAIADVPYTIHTLLAGTNGSGVFVSIDNGNHWEAINRDLTDSHIQTMTVNSKGELFVGTLSSGVFRSQDNGNHWEPIGYHQRPSRGAIASSDSTVIGTGTHFDEDITPGLLITAADQTRIVSNLDSTHPDSILTVDRPFLPPGLPEGTPYTLSTGLTNPNITTLLAYDRNTGTNESLNKIFAGTKGGGIFCLNLNTSDPSEKAWRVMNQGLTNLEITLLVAYYKRGTGQLSISSEGTEVSGIGTYFTSELATGTLIAVNNQIRIVKSILSDTLLIVHQAFDLDSSRSTFEIDTLLAATETAGIFESIDQGEHWNPINHGLTNTTIRTIAARLNSDRSTTLFVGGTGFLPSIDGLSQVPLQRGDILRVMQPPESTIHSQQWHLIDINQFEGILATTTSEDLVLQPADSSDEIISELVEILTPPDNQLLPVLKLQTDLHNSYDPATVTLHANIVPATQGETIPDREELLGSGDGNLANQQFALKKPPLTYVSSSATEGTTSTLQIRVNGLLWKQVPSLYNLRPDDQVYIVRTEDDGTTIVTFGDGINGARLPSGLDNIVATYRSGIGLAGNVKANQLTLLKTRPLGLQGVTNPLAATGASDRETTEQARTRAPSTVRTLGRVVSLRDFEDFTRSFAGIGKVTAIALWTAQTKVVHLTIAGMNGNEIPTDSALYTNLVTAIEAVRDPYQLPPIIASYDRVWFRLAATILVNPRYELEIVKSQVETTLKTTFVFEQRNFGQSVTAAEAIALIQSIEGVIAVDLDFLHRVDAARTLETTLPTSLARWDEVTQTFYPAQLLLLHAAEITAKLGEPL